MAITATFQANFDQFVGEVKKANDSLEGIATTAKTVGVAVAASLAAAEFRRFSSDAVQAATVFIAAFSEEESAVGRLTAALRANGTFTPELLEHYKQLGQEFQNTTRFSDDMIFSSEAMLTQVGNVLPGQMKNALQAVADLAVGMGPQVGGLQGATLLVAKAMAGGTVELGRLKGILGDSHGPITTTEELLAALHKQFGGQAEADIRTTAGQMEQFKNKSSDAKEAVGGLLIDALLPLMKAFTSLPTEVQTTIVAVGVIGTALAPVALSFAALAATMPALITAIGASGFTGVLTRLLPFLGPAGWIAAGVASWIVVFRNLDVILWAVQNPWKALTGLIKESVGPIIGYAQAIFNGVKTWLVDRFASIVESIRSTIGAVTGFFRDLYDKVAGHSYVPDMMRVIASEFALLASLMVAPAQTATQGVTQAFQTMASDVVRSGAVFRSEVVGMLNLEDQLQATHQAAIAAQEAALAPRQALQAQGGTSVIPTTLVTDTNRAYLERRLATIAASYAQYPGRMAGGSGRTGAMDARGWSNMLNEQIEFQSLTNALRNSVPFSSGGGGGGVTIAEINVTQPLGTPEAIGRAISDHLTRAILQGRKVAV